MRILATMLFGGLVLAALTGATAAEPQATAGGGLCELRIEGGSIISLQLEGKNGSRTTCSQPAKALHLPAGSYRVSEVHLEGEYGWTGFGKKAGPWFELSAGRPQTVKVGTPLSSTVKITRQGPYLKLDYELVDAEGRSYTNELRHYSEPPRFVVYANDQKIGSGSFRYG
jgi:hypothetical protein